MNVLSDQDAEVQRLHHTLDALEERLVEFLREVHRPDFYSLSAFEKMFRICRETLHDYRHRGWISFVRFRGKRYISREEVEALIEGNYFPAFDPVVAASKFIPVRKAGEALAPEELMEELERIEQLFTILILRSNKKPLTAGPGGDNNFD